jgi:uncharacterized protein involved in exopolysaccharide biosynthesis/Mrp family chromosome partitioning ATPase
MGEYELGLREILGVIRRQLRLILLTLLLALAVATGIVLAARPVYTAAALVLVDPSRKDLLEADPTTAQAPLDSPRVDSEVEIVKSDATMLKVVADANLLQQPGYSLQPGLFDRFLTLVRLKQPVDPTPDDLLRYALKQLREQIAVQRIGLTYLISVEARSGDPALAATIANAVAKAYIANQLSAKIDGVVAAGQVIDARIADANQAVVASEQAFDNYIGDNIGRIADATGRADLVDLKARLDTLKSQSTSLASEVSLTDRSYANRDWSTLASTLKDDAIAKLEADRAALVASGDAVNGDGRSIRDQLAQIDADLRARADASLSALKTRLATTQSGVSDLRGQLRRDVLGSDLPAETLASIYSVQQNAEIARGQYQSLLARSKALQSQAYLQVPDSRVVSAATPPGDPSSPNVRLIFVLAGVLGLVGGVGMAFLYENYVGGFTSLDQLRGMTRLVVPTAVPRQAEIKPERDGSYSIADRLLTAPLSAFSESIRRLRVGVDQAARRVRRATGTPEAGASTVVMVSSASPGDGKSTIALSLARAYALSGKTTLLVDCDLRRPSLHAQLGLAPSAGLIDYLGSGGSAGLAPIIVPDAASTAHLVIGARLGDVATDQFVTGEAFGRLIEQAQAAYEIVILDTPPIGVVVDGLYIAAHVDVAVMVVRFGATGQRELRASLLALDDARQPASEVVAVLNQLSARESAYNEDYGGYHAGALG